MHEWEIGIGRLVKLQDLAISHASLEEWPLQMERLTNLMYLDLSHNRIQRVPNTIEENSEIKLLNLSYNLLEYLPPEIYKLPLQVRFLQTDIFILVNILASGFIVENILSRYSMLDYFFLYCVFFFSLIT